MVDPARYYRNNVGDTLTLLEALVAPENARQGLPMPLVFSSTCATYGMPELSNRMWLMKEVSGSCEIHCYPG